MKYSDVYSSDDSEYEEARMQDAKDLVNNFVVVEYKSKRSVKNYIGMVLSEEVGGFSVKFLRSKTDGSFYFPEEDDIALVDYCDIKQVLNSPELNRRQNYVFKGIHKKFLNIG